MTNDEILSLIDRLTVKAKRDARRISAKLEAGKITQDEWQTQMLALLTAANLIAGIVGRGGRAKMQPADWQRIQRKVDWQESFLPRFGALIVAGTLVGAAIARRANLYGDAPFITYQDSKREAAIENKGDKPILARLIVNSAEGCEECAADEGLGWIPVDDLAPLGTRECGNFCKCDIEFSDDEGRDATDYDPQFEMR